MHVFLLSLVQHGLAPIRYHWKEILNHELQRHGKVSQKEHEFAMVVCLIEAAATSDKGCIDATVRLKKAGLLDPQALKEATLDKIYDCIKEAGFGEISSKYLKENGAIIVDKFNGEVPRTAEGLMELRGINRKAANVISAEIFGKIHGIAVDRHVHDVWIALRGHKVPGWLKTSDVDHVEMSLRTFVSVFDYPMINPVMGGMAQLWTNMYGTVTGKEKIAKAALVIRAMGDHLCCLLYTSDAADD